MRKTEFNHYKDQYDFVKTVKKRMKEFLSYEEETEADFLEKIDAPSFFFSSNFPVRNHHLKKMLLHYPYANIIWLLTGIEQINVFCTEKFLETNRANIKRLEEELQKAKEEWDTDFEKDLNALKEGFVTNIRARIPDKLYHSKIYRF